MPLAQVLLSLFLGFLGGSYGTLVGIGGGILFVPFLLLFLHASAQQAVGTSLAVVFVNSLSGTIAYLRQRRVDLKSGLIFASAILPATIFGVWLSKYLNSTILSVIVAFFLIGISLFIFLFPYREKIQESMRVKRTIKAYDGHVFAYSPRIRLGVLFSFFIGVTYGLLGIGGGIILLPLMILVLGFPPHIATATSIFILAISAFFGAFSHLILGNVLILPSIIMVMGVIPGAQLGALLSRKLKAGVITRLLALAMTFLGLWLLLRTL